MSLPTDVSKSLHVPKQGGNFSLWDKRCDKWRKWSKMKVKLKMP